MSRVSIYSIREKLLLNNMTRTMVKPTADAQTKVIRQFHPDIPAIRLDGPLTYCFYITIQNLIHLNVVYILFYHTIFWLDSTSSKNEIVHFVKKLENTEYEQTSFLAVTSNHDDIVRPTINIHLINKHVYITLIGVSTIELIAAFIWTLQKRLSFLVQRNLRWRNRLRLLIIGMILIVYITFIAWLVFHTFITHCLTLAIFSLVLIHFIILTILDKPNLFRDISIDLRKGLFSTISSTRKQHRHFPIPSSLISSRKLHSPMNSLLSSARWTSVTEQKLDTHECTTIYADIRTEADDLWAMMVRRMALKFYRTFASFIFFDLMPYKMMGANISSTENQRYKILIIIFALSTFLTHSVFLFPIKLQANLHRLSTHLGQWRLKPFTGTETIHRWSSECNSYTNHNMIKLSSNNMEKYFLAMEHFSNAAHPLSISHSIIYRFFGDMICFLSLQFRLCSVLICCQLFWIIPGRFGFETLISLLIILNSSYTIFKIIRDRLLFDMIDEHESDAFLLTSKQKKSN